MRAILEAGLSIPQDIAVIGAANTRYSDMLQIPLSTLDQGIPEMGKQAAHLLLASMAAKKPPAPRQVIVTPRLVLRASSQWRSAGLSKSPI
jgi:LacI family transcriptional regulator